MFIDDTPLDFDCYYFLGPPEDEANRNYPVVKTLSAFTLPSVLPDRWAQIMDARQQQRPCPPQIWLPWSEQNMPLFVQLRDKQCAITRCTNGAFLLVLYQDRPCVSVDGRGLWFRGGICVEPSVPPSTSTSVRSAFWRRRSCGRR